MKAAEAGRIVLPVLAATLALVGLAELSDAWVPSALVVAVVAGVVAVVTSAWRPTRGAIWRLLPLVGALAVEVAWATSRPAADAVAGLAALALLWVGGSGSERPLGRAAGGLLLPGAGLALAMTVFVALPAGTQNPFAAGLLALFGIGLLAWALQRPVALASASAS